MGDVVDKCLENPEDGLRVKCTIEKMGPSHAHWMNQHPLTKQISAVPVGRFSREGLGSRKTSSSSTNGSLRSKIVSGRNQRPRFFNTKRPITVRKVQEQSICKPLLNLLSYFVTNRVPS